MNRISTDYRVLNAANTVLQTFSTADLALKWASRNAEHWPGLHVEEVVTTHRRIWREWPVRAAADQPQGVPSCP